jgi:hypothetical protein
MDTPPSRVPILSSIYPIRFPKWAKQETSEEMMLKENFERFLEFSGTSLPIVEKTGNRYFQNHPGSVSCLVVRPRAALIASCNFAWSMD